MSSPKSCDLAQDIFAFHCDGPWYVLSDTFGINHQATFHLGKIGTQAMLPKDQPVPKWSQLKKKKDQQKGLDP